MNIIKYLPQEYKIKCIECEAPLIRENGEIYCSVCGLIFLDSSAMIPEIIDYAINSQNKSQKKSQKKTYITKIMELDQV